MEVVDGALEFVIEVLVDTVEGASWLLTPEEVEFVSSLLSNLLNLALVYFGISGLSKLYILNC